MAHKPGKYKRYVPRYRPELRWRQETCMPGFLLAYWHAWDRSQVLGMRVPIVGYSGWMVSSNLKVDLV